jgi:LPXTG-motif cell wall-anchored protein
MMFNYVYLENTEETFMITNSNSKARITLSIAIIAVLIVALLSPGGIFPADSVYAADNTFTEDSETAWIQGENIDSGARYTDASGRVAYCMNQGAATPSGGYPNSYIADAQVTAAIYYGYPNNTTIQGYALTADQAQCATQVALWGLGGLNLDNLHGHGSYTPTSTTVLAAAKALLAKAQGGFTPTPSDISIPSSQRAHAYDADYVRYGPYSVSDSTAVKVTLDNEPFGSYIGKENGTMLNVASIPVGTDFYLYVPVDADTTQKINIEIGAYYEVYNVVIFWRSGGYQSMGVPGDPGFGLAEADADLLPFGRLEITKTDSVTEEPLPGVTFKIQEWNGSEYVNRSYDIDWDNAAKKYISETLFVTETNEGKFRVVETGNPSKYFPPEDPNDWSKTFTITGYGKATGVSATNVPFKHNPVVITKLSNGAGESGWKLGEATFKVQEWNGSAYVDNTNGYTFAWDAGTRTYRTQGGPFSDGQLWETVTNQCRFRIVETSNPYSYIGTWSADIVVTGNTQTLSPPIAREASNTPTYAKIHVQKLDKDTNTATPQGDAIFEKATYGLYAAENITHPNGSTSYTTDQLIEQKETDGEGKLTFDKGGKLFPMKYYVREISPSEGHLLDATKYYVDVTHANEATVTVKSQNVTEQVKKRSFSLLKVGDNAEDSELVPLEAGFTVYLISELSKVKSGEHTPEGADWKNTDFGGYDFSSEPAAKVDGVTLPELFTDTSGLLLSPELPYGKYVVVETTVPEGRKGIVPFVVDISEDSRTPVSFIMNNTGVEYYIKIVKKDSGTGELVLNKEAAYRIYDMDKQHYVTMMTTYPKPETYGTAENPFRTDGSGTLITPQKLPYGHYRLDEADAPDGYVRQGYEGILIPGYQKDADYTPDPKDAVYIDMDELTPIPEESIKADVLEVVQYNEPQKGKISLYKEGEVFSGAVSGGGIYSFPAETKPISGAAFHIIAAEDIYTQDGHGTLILTGGAIAAQLVTDADGKAASDALPIGRYILKEISAPEGFLLTEDREFAIEGGEQELPFCFHAYDITDERQKLNIEILKMEEGSDFPLAGAVFGLYAAEDIPVGDGSIEPLSALGKIKGFFYSLFSSDYIYMIPEGTLIRTAVSGEDGKILFSDLPPGKYYVRELQAPEGFEINDDWQPELTLAYDGRERESITRSETCVDEVFGYAEIHKTGERFADLTNQIITATAFKYSNTVLRGAVFEILDADGEMIEEITTDENGYAKSSKLRIGEYILREKTAPAGYLRTEDKAFSIKPRHGRQQENIFTYEIEDTRQKLNIEILKEDEDAGQPLVGAVFALIAEGDIKTNSGTDEKQFVIAKGTRLMLVKTGKNGKAVFPDIPAGAYRVEEISAPDGYELNRDFHPVIKADYDSSGDETLVFRELCTDKKLPMPQPQPKTGDDANIGFWIGLLAVALGGVIAIFIIRRKNRR